MSHQVSNHFLPRGFLLSAEMIIAEGLKDRTGYTLSQFHPTHSLLPVGEKKRQFKYNVVVKRITSEYRKAKKHFTAEYLLFYRASNNIEKQNVSFLGDLCSHTCTWHFDTNW